MTDAYIRWSDVRIDESTDSTQYDGFGQEVVRITTWTAEFEGSVHPREGDTGISEAVVSFSRSGPTAESAAVALIQAAQEQGWELI